MSELDIKKMAEAMAKRMEYGVKSDIEVCRDKKICMFCHEPGGVYEIITQKAEKPLLACIKCIHIIKLHLPHIQELANPDLKEVEETG